MAGAVRRIKCTCSLSAASCLAIRRIFLLAGICSLAAVITRKFRLCLSILLAIAIYWTVSDALLWSYPTIRTAARWLLWSRDYKSSVLAQPDPVNGELKHIEWDGWGFPGAGDTAVDLVFDPSDSLASAAQNHRSGKFSGIPCEVPSVRRLESHWYTVLFYTDQFWERCN